MKILYFYQYFATPKGSWGTRVYEFAKRWVEAGHQVTVVTSVYYKSDLEAEGLVRLRNFDGIDVVVLGVEISNKHSAFKRALSWINYCVLSSWYALTAKADVVVASSGPITVGVPGLLARLRGRKLVFEVRDLWPEGSIELGLVKNALLKKLLYAFEKLCYRASRLVVTLSPGMAENITGRYSDTQTLSVPNVADNQLFGRARDAAWGYPDPIGDRKVVIYTGNIGQVNNSVFLYETALALRDAGREDIVILLVGDGQQREMLQARAEEDQLKQFHIQGLMPKVELVNWVQRAMVSVVPLKGTPVLDTSSPNKLFDSLAAGVPVVQTTNGWIRTLLEENDCGYTVDPNDPKAFATLLMEIADHPDPEMGQRAKALALQEFDKSVLADRMLDGLVKVHES